MREPPPPSTTGTPRAAHDRRMACLERRGLATKEAHGHLSGRSHSSPGGKTWKLATIRTSCGKMPHERLDGVADPFQWTPWRNDTRRPTTCRKRPLFPTQPGRGTGHRHHALVAHDDAPTEGAPTLTREPGRCMRHESRPAPTVRALTGRLHHAHSAPTGPWLAGSKLPPVSACCLRLDLSLRSQPLWSRDASEDGRTHPDAASTPGASTVLPMNHPTLPRSKAQGSTPGPVTLPSWATSSSRSRTSQASPSETR